MRKAFLAAAATVAVTFSAQAADLPDSGGPLTHSRQIFSWNGIYFGGNVGYLWGDSYVFDVFAPGDRTRTFDMNGFIVGVQGGINYQTGAWVWGAEADLQYSDADGSTFAGCACGSELNWYGSVRGRLGYSFDQALLYVTGGFAYGGTDTYNAPFSFSDTEFGWTVGGGLEFGFSPNWSARAEYLYMDLGKAESTSAGFGGSYDSNHIVRMGINYHFK